jgi:hypothetical protein
VQRNPGKQRNPVQIMPAIEDSNSAVLARAFVRRLLTGQ